MDIMRYLPAAIIIGVIAYVIWLDYQNRNNRSPKWVVRDLPGDRKAVTMPPFGIYIEPDAKNNQEVKKHEECHWQQYKNKGLIKFWADYLKFSNQYDYANNPMEVECFNNH